MPLENPEKEKDLEDLINEMKMPNIYESPEKREDHCAKIRRIYADKYRHNYSYLYRLLDPLFSSEDLDTLNTLSENLAILYKILEDKGGNELVLEKFEKLCDHINLEIGRYNLYRKKFTSQEANQDAAPKTTAEDFATKEEMNENRQIVEKYISETKKTNFDLEANLKKSNETLTDL